MIRMPAPLREITPALALLLLALSLPACSESATETCSSGMVCPAGWSCSADGLACIEGKCGDGIQQEGEVCDDGNIRSGDGCNGTCTSNELCGNGVQDPGEACDDGNTLNEDSCSGDCKHSAECGNHNLDVNEECDPPGDRDGFRCSLNCKIAFCGNGRVDDGEECDDGNPSNEDSCLNTCKWNTCGDGYRNPEKEACDEGPANGTSTCPYGTQGCDVCNARCTAREPGTGPYCGDGTLTSPLEECDFGQVCGTCSAQCRHVTPQPAHGRIKVVDLDKLSSGDIFVISDGFKLPLTFEFCYSSRCDTTCHPDGPELRHCWIRFNPDEAASKLAARIAGTINYTNKQDWLDVQAESTEGSSTVVLNNDSLVYMGAAGNQSMLTTASPSALMVEGMSGGIGYDCPENSPCSSDEDCERPLHCDSSKHCSDR